MSRTTKWLSVISGAVLLAATVGCGGTSPASSKDGGGVGTGGSAGGSGGTGGAHADAGNTGGSTGTGGAQVDAGSGGSSGSGGAHDAAGTGGSGGAGGVHVDAAGTGGSGGALDARSDATATADGSADAAGACPSSANAKACVACCDALHPGGFQDAFFGNECLYCTAACGSTKLCTGVTDNPTNDIDGPCLACAQPRLGGNCRFMSAPRCPALIECLKRCPTN
ncbi:MAG TPA: hypothetical protein VFH73_17630 [Polyangia bacterium]|jgi:hypothetical protein|nr:hypothetical protein [Polyangia bacterium]